MPVAKDAQDVQAVPVIAKTADSPTLQHVGDCYGVSISIDVSWHTDPASYLEVEAFASSDNGVTWPLSLGKAGRWGGTSTFMGTPSTVMQLDCAASKPLAKDVQIKTVTRTSNKDDVLPQPVFAGKAAPIVMSAM